MEKQDLGKEIYRVKRSKIFGHPRIYLSIWIVPIVVYFCFQKNNILSILCAIFFIIGTLLFLNQKTFRKIILYENGFTISCLYTMNFMYNSVNSLYISRSTGIFFKNFGAIIIMFSYKKTINNFRTWLDLDTSLITKEEAKKIIEIFKEKGVKYVEYDNAKL